MSDNFPCFSANSLKFYRNLSCNNNRQWFSEHRSEYVNHVQSPARQLAEKLGPMVAELDPRIETEPHRIISRINRDTRFSNDKSPYRPRTFLAFHRSVERWSETPTFFFQVEETRYLFGMGIYGAPPAMMRRFRSLIDDDPETFYSVVEPILRNRSMALESDKYKRPFPAEFPETISAKIIPWYQSKTIGVLGYRQPDKTLFSPKLADFLIDRFVLLKPLYDFLWKCTVL